MRMRAYLEIMDEVMKEGVDREELNGNTRALFGLQMRFDLSKGFPSMTTKKRASKTEKG